MFSVCWVQFFLTSTGTLEQKVRVPTDLFPSFAANLFSSCAFAFPLDFKWPASSEDLAYKHSDSYGIGHRRGLKSANQICGAGTSRQRFCAIRFFHDCSVHVGKDYGETMGFAAAFGPGDLFWQDSLGVFSFSVYIYCKYSTVTY